MASLPLSEEDVFNTARRMGAADRDAYLEDVCAGDTQLKNRLQTLLGVDDSFLQRPATLIIDQLPERPGTTAGPYKLLEEIGEGGFGVVYLAEDAKRKQVAVKVIKPGMDTRQVLARFDAERQMLSLMDHPNIARVLNAGALPSGRPWFAMELVRGPNITDFCDRQRLAIVDRLRLAIDVSLAVAHAHQKGIIHRDLKPANVLVAQEDGAAVVKVIDFGIAKALTGPMTDRTLFTRYAHLLGTPSAMSPEQLDGSGNIDTRADVYALGVLIYELLTGTTPFNREQFQGADVDQIRRIVGETQPPRPSTRIDTAVEAATHARNRRSEPRRLSRLLRGDLDWIVMKCLEKDRRRRYATAGELARDLKRYLAAEPVEARPPSAAYRFSKFVHRNRTLVIAGSLLAATLVAGIVGTSWGLWTAEQARKAESQRAEAEGRERQRAEGAEAAALDRLSLANAVTDFLENDLLIQAGSKAQADRNYKARPNLTVREALDRAAENLGARFADRPALEASLRDTLGRAYLSLEENPKAIEQFQRSARLFDSLHSPDVRSTLSARYGLATALQHDGQIDAAMKLFEEVYGRLTAAFGPDDRDTLSALAGLAQTKRLAGKSRDALALTRKLHADHVRLFSAKDPQTLTVQDNLGTLHLEAGEPAAAVKILEEVRDARVAVLPANHPDTLRTLSNLAGAYLQVGQPAKALATLKDMRETTARVLGPDHSVTLTVLDTLAGALCESGDLPAGLKAYEELCHLREEHQGAEHPATAQARGNLGAWYCSLQDYDKAIPLLEPALATKIAKNGDASYSTLQTRLHLAKAYQSKSRFADAIVQFETVYRHSGSFEGLQFVGDFLVDAYTVAGQNDKAIALLNELLIRDRETYPAGSGERAACFAQRGVQYAKAGAWVEMEAVLIEALTIRQKLEPDAWTTFNTHSLLGGAQSRLMKFPEAESHLLTAREGFTKLAATSPLVAKPRAIENFKRFVQLYTSWDKPVEAARWKAELDAAEAALKK